MVEKVGVIGFDFTMANLSRVTAKRAAACI